MQEARDQIEQHRETLLQIEEVEESIKKLRDRQSKIEEDIEKLRASSANSRPAKRQRVNDTSGVQNTSTPGSASQSKSKKRGRSAASDTESEDSDEHVECGTAVRGGAAKHV